MIAHDDVIKWKIFPRYLSLVWDIHRSPVYFSHKGQWRFDDFIDLRLNKWLSKQSRRRWLEIPLSSLRRHYYARTSWHGTLFRFTGYLWRKDIQAAGGFPSQKTGSLKLWCLIYCLKLELPVIGNTMTPMWRLGNNYMPFYHLAIGLSGTGECYW